MPRTSISTPEVTSAMVGRNMLTVLTHLAKDGALVVDAGDEITGAMLVKQ